MLAEAHNVTFNTNSHILELNDIPPDLQEIFKKSSWFEEFKFQYGLVIDEKKLREGNVKPFDDPPTSPKIKPINLTKATKTITNSMLHSYLLEIMLELLMIK